MEKTLYRRPLPDGAIAFSSPEGRQLFGEALAAGGLDGYFPLAEQFHTQQDPSFCGLGSLVVALNALAIDPGRLWKGPWRWFGEELLDCCVPLPEVQRRGLSLDELGCLARCNGADVILERADDTNESRFRAAVDEASRGRSVLVAAYDRSALGQTGSGHFSPIAGYHASRDLVLVLDVARFKYPPHWVSTQRLWSAMHPIDPATNLARGWLLLRARGTALAFSVCCNVDEWRQANVALRAALAALGPAATIEDLARTVAPFARVLETRAARSDVHVNALEQVRAALHRLELHRRVVDALGAERADAVAMLLLAYAELLPPSQRRTVEAHATALDGDLHAELRTLREQVRALAAAPSA